MKRLYYRPAGPSARALLAVGALSLGLLLGVEGMPRRVEQQAYQVKLEAARRAERAITTLRRERLARGLELSALIDPAGTGILGAKATEVTTATGNLSSKRTSANPNFAAVMVEYLTRLGVERGDLIAVGCSGSFPGLNIAVLAAIETLGLEPVVIASATASDFGANLPEFMWLDMEQVLLREKVFQARSIAASIGGIEDQGLGLSREARQLVLGLIQESGAQPITPESFRDSLEARMRIYDERARGRPYVAYVNVGGGAVSVGRSRGKSFFRPGINRPGPEAPVDAIIGRFLERGVPVVHLTQIKTLAAQFGLPVDPQRPIEVGQGEVFLHQEPNRPLALGCLLLIGVALSLIGRRARARAHLANLPEGETLDARAEEARRR